MPTVVQADIDAAKAKVDSLRAEVDGLAPLLETFPFLGHYIAIAKEVVDGADDALDAAAADL
jgi:hypothetical protein